MIMASLICGTTSAHATGTRGGNRTNPPTGRGAPSLRSIRANPEAEAQKPVPSTPSTWQHAAPNHEGRETALAACCKVLQSHGALTTFDFSRQVKILVKIHWSELGPAKLRPLRAAVAAPPGALEWMTSVNLHEQDRSAKGEM